MTTAAIDGGVIRKKVFYSYAHEDRRLLENVKRHLSLLRRQNLLEDWHDGLVRPGANWNDEISAALAAADLILLLVSAYFLASDFCYDEEMTAAIERHQNGEATVVPVIVKPCDWHGAPFGGLQALPTDGRPVTTWDNREAAYLSIATGIRKLVETN